MRLRASTSSSTSPAELEQGSFSRWPEAPVYSAGRKAELILPEGDRRHLSPCPELIFRIAVPLCLTPAVQLQHTPAGNIR